MRYINLALGLVHLVALCHFALNYLRFDVKSSNSSTGQPRNQIISNFIERIDEEILKVKMKNVNVNVKPKFDRFVFFLLDAWRWNFLFNSEEETEAEGPMKFLKSKVMSGVESVGLVSLSRIPTVTKPCLKSIFTGTLPVFFEIVENIDESGLTSNVKTSTNSASTTDNLLERLQKRGKKLAVYGDDVWSKLFPIEIFHRSQVSFGFNIMDYVEVDNLVHRGLEVEIEKSKSLDGSDVLILHYLGLDHIGHSYAAKSEFVNPKLKEMDTKIEEIYEWIKERDASDSLNGMETRTLMLVMGDHGMTKEGNHGGGSKDEVQAGAVFMSPHFKNPLGGFETWKQAVKMAENDSHHQEDIGATLTALLDGTGTGNPLKFGSGCLIERVMKASFDEEEERALLLGNLKHLLEKLTRRKYEESEIFISNFITKEIISNENIYLLSKELKGILNADNFTFQEGKLKVAVGVMGMISLIYLVRWLINRKFSLNLESLSELVAIVTIGICQGGTSFIAEEHVLWRGMFVAFVLIWAMKMKTREKRINEVISDNGLVYLKIGLLLLLHRILCGWNGVGTMWSHELTISSILKQTGKVIENFAVAIGLILILIMAMIRMKRKEKHFMHSKFESFLFFGAACFIVFLHKTTFTLTFTLFNQSIPNHILAQSVLIILISEKLYTRNYWKDLDISLGILSVLVNKPSNAIPVAILLTMSQVMGNLEQILGPTGCLLRISLMQGSFYGLGLWNSVSAVDLTFGAIFSKSFNMTTAPVVLLMYCWSGPVLVAVSLKKNNYNYRGWMEDLMFYRGFLDFMACAFAFHHRFHPWIFDFFSPKILFQVFWAAFYLILFPIITAFKIK